MTSEEENERILSALESTKRWKQCVSCERTFDEGTVCPWCKNGWVYGYLDEDGNTTFDDEK